MDLNILNQLKDRRVTAEALSEVLAAAIEKSILEPGHKLPSTRDISTYLGVSRTTVMKAFDTLIARGFVTSSQGAGTWVSKNLANQASSSAAERSENLSPKYQWLERTNDFGRSLHLLGSELIESADFDEINFGSGPADLVPLGVWRKILLNLTSTKDAITYDDNNDVFGYRPLREAIAGFLKRTKGLICDAEQIVVSSGIQGVVSPVFSLLAKPGDLFVCENPGFWGARELFHSHGGEIAFAEVDDHGLIVDSLKSLDRPAQWLYIASSCQEPYGVTLSEDRRQQLLDWCHANKTAILEDDWDSEFHYDRSSVPTLFSLDKTDSVIYYYTFWRLLYPLVSVGFLVVPHQLIDVFSSYKNVCDRQFTLIEHRVLTEMLNAGHVEAHMRNMWKSFRKRRQALIFSLTQYFGSKIQIIPSSVGMHVTVRFAEGLSADEIRKCAVDSGVPIASTTPFYAHSVRPNEFMVRFANMAQEEIEPSIKAFADALLK